MVTKTFYKTKDYCKVKFSVQLENAETISVVGLNNNWKKGIELSPKKDGSFIGDINLQKGTKHEFKYLVNKTEWINEPEADGELMNIYGTANSLLEV